jgi:hypothetical protein
MVFRTTLKAPGGNSPFASTRRNSVIYLKRRRRSGQPGQTENIQVTTTRDRVGTLDELNDSHQFSGATMKGLSTGRDSRSGLARPML